MDANQRKALLNFARETMRARLTGGSPPTPPAVAIPPEQFGGAFVTIRNRGRLRGCIGQFSPTSSLPETVQQMAGAALEDPRFVQLPVTAGELPQLDVEISVLSPMEQTREPLSLQPGVHGIYIRRGGRSGCFLPQVATEQRWGAEEFLSQCCAGKAGLPADAWRDPKTEVYLFRAEVFGEK